VHQVELTPNNVFTYNCNMITDTLLAMCEIGAYQHTFHSIRMAHVGATVCRKVELHYSPELSSL